MIQSNEIMLTVQHLQSTFEDLAVRGLRSVGSEQMNVLSSIHDELDRIGAAHLAGRVLQLIECIRRDDRSAASALMRAQASLRVFERILTLESAFATLSVADDLSDPEMGDDLIADGDGEGDEDD